MTGIVDVGGGFRGIYAAGALDFCMDNGITFDLGIGVSAGSANLASFLSQQVRRNLKFYTEYGMRKEYAGIENFLRKRSFVDLDYAYSTLSNSDGEYPIDYEAFSKNPMEFIVVATDAETGEAKYFDKSDYQQDHYDPFKASSSLPFFSQPYPIGDHVYYDGALADPVPVLKALEYGCDKVVVLLTKPKDLVRVPGKDLRVAKAIEAKYPAAARELRSRAQKYNAGVELAKKLERQGQALIVAPDDTCGVSTLTRNKEKLLKLYEKGYADGAAIADFMK